jgi:predicted adenine nucleotide alpha hydrolase (AANH) superfamily ATPase
LLLHICCAPCSIYSWEYFSASGYNVQGYFFNPNIHPYREFARRLENVRTLGQTENLPILFNESYPMEDFLRLAIDAEAQRCRICYEMRLEETARYAAEAGITNISTTLLLSPYQKHGLLKSAGEKAAASAGVNFIYADLRSGFAQSMREAKAKELYRQGYCGCIFSEKERYFVTQEPGVRSQESE